MSKLLGYLAKDRGIVLFIALELAAFLVFFLNPSYPIVVYVTSALFGFYLIYKFPSSFFFSRKFLLLLVIAVPFLLVPVLTANPDYEAVHTYRSLFDTLDQGKNPYTCDNIYHRVDNEVVYGNFNYPPLEIPFYWLANLFLGSWNVWYMILMNFLVRFLICFLFMKTTPDLRHIQRLPFYLIFLLWGSEYPLTMTFLIVALLMYFLVKKTSVEKKGTPIRYVPFLFVLGLLTKFFMIPIFFAFYYFYFFDLGKRKKTVVHLALIALVGALLLLPFGIFNVLDSTALFNLNLSQRGAYTTFYPNVVSIFFDWMGSWLIYAFFGVGAFFSSLYFFDDSLLKKIVYACMVFMIFMPTPEPQFLPILFYIVVVSKYSEFYDRVPRFSLPDG
ncbi:hypothetical protein AKJ57_06270 [candidate division MSBL1 archaeon SCGC-AAA259A05]|uniref:Glycosyltransferase RgtA/B/C/D-like domain-containing protein n=1 Tax=candidate division MSBL1 archaeon SCGC-AAA259A05 TaxID=1698259 RepID=A0A133U3Q1_9EURY|nr:hypothetical protein AKJ57_06270 [candidate division MSBL1 archaeon SCGC-AAA259A05]